MSRKAAWKPVRQGIAEWNGGKPEGTDNPPHLEGRPAEEIVIEGRRPEPSAPVSDAESAIF